MRQTIGTLPALLAPGGIVIWTRSATSVGHDPSADIRDCFARHSFTETSVVSTEDGTFKVGRHRLGARQAGRLEPAPGTRMFTFA